MKRLSIIWMVALLQLPLMANVFYYQPSVGYCGDPMPFYDTNADVFRIYYLHDMRPNPEWTFHPVYAIETNDLVHYTALGEVLPTGDRYAKDAMIGTGSVIYCQQDNTYYFFYTGNKHKNYDEECRQVILCATSSDGIYWKKTDFVIDANIGYYYRDDFRDPEVFLGEDGLYHMLVSTGKDGENILAELTSPNCRDWTDKGVFMTTMWDRFYECPNVFKMGDWWYLVYSEIHREIRRVQYFKSRTYEGLKLCTADNVAQWPDDHEGYLDSRGFYAGKTASDGTNRYIWGWCPTRRNYDNTAVNNEYGEPDWGGTLVANRLIQHEDGSLTLGMVPGIAEYFNTDEEVPCTTLNLSAGQHQLFAPLPQQTHLSFTIVTNGAEDKFGISVARDNNTGIFYSLIVNPEENNMRKVNFEQEGGIGFIPYIDSYFFAQPADRTYHVDIFIDNSILVLYINDAVCYTNRVYRMQNHGWSINCYSGSIQVSDIHQRIYDANYTDILSINESLSSGGRKHILNGRLVICRDGKNYSALGASL